MPYTIFRQCCRMNRWAALLLCLIPSILSAPSDGQSADDREYQVKAGFIYHFVRFTQWPATVFAAPDSPIVLCLASTTPESEAIRSLEGKMIRNRPIMIKKIEGVDNPDTCHVVMVASKDEQFIVNTLKSFENKSVLTIGETGFFPEMGGIITFVVRANRLSFLVNRDSAEKSGLKFSSQLLMSAELYHGGR